MTLERDSAEGDQSEGEELNRAWFYLLRCSAGCAVLPLNGKGIDQRERGPGSSRKRKEPNFGWRWRGTEDCPETAGGGEDGAENHRLTDPLTGFYEEQKTHRANRSASPPPPSHIAETQLCSDSRYQSPPADSRSHRRTPWRALMRRRQHPPRLLPSKRQLRGQSACSEQRQSLPGKRVSMEITIVSGACARKEAFVFSWVGEWMNESIYLF